MTPRLSRLTTSGLIKLRWEPVSKKARTFACSLQYLTLSVAVGNKLLGKLLELMLVTYVVSRDGDVTLA